VSIDHDHAIAALKVGNGCRAAWHHVNFQRGNELAANDERCEEKYRGE